MSMKNSMHVWINIKETQDRVEWFDYSGTRYNYTFRTGAPSTLPTFETVQHQIVEFTKNFEDRLVTKLQIQSNDRNYRRYQHKNKQLLLNILEYFSKFQCFISEVCLTNIKLNLELIQKIKWKFLVIIDLCDNNLNDKGIFLLTKLILSYLQSFKCSSNPIGNKGIKHIARAQWPRLKLLALQNVSITSDACKYLVRIKRKDALNVVFNKQSLHSAVTPFDLKIIDIFRKEPGDPIFKYDTSRLVFKNQMCKSPYFQKKMQAEILTGNYLHQELRDNEVDLSPQLITLLIENVFDFNFCL